MSSPYRIKFKYLSAVLVLAAAGCQPDMREQDKPHPQGYSRAFSNHMDARPMVPGAVAFNPAGTPPAARPISRVMLEQGRDGFQTFCSPCHGYTGGGHGMVVQHGFPQPPSLLEERLQRAPDSYLFGTISQGAGAMPAYAKQIAESERWAIVAYVRALQLSQAKAATGKPHGGTP